LKVDIKLTGYCIGLRKTMKDAGLLVT